MFSSLTNEPTNDSTDTVSNGSDNDSGPTTSKGNTNKRDANCRKPFIVFFISFLASGLLLFVLLNIIRLLAKSKQSRLDLTDIDDDNTTIYNTNSVDLSTICGVNNPFRNRSSVFSLIKTNRIINGDNVFANTYPWIVSFRTIDKTDKRKIKSHFCAGLLN